MPQLCSLPAEAYLTARKSYVARNKSVMAQQLHDSIHSALSDRSNCSSTSSMSPENSATQSNQQTVTDNTTFGMQHNQQITANNTMSHTQFN